MTGKYKAVASAIIIIALILAGLAGSVFYWHQRLRPQIIQESMTPPVSPHGATPGESSGNGTGPPPENATQIIRNVNSTCRLVKEPAEYFYICNMDGDSFKDVVTWTEDHNKTTGANNDSILILENGTTVINYTFKDISDTGIISIAVGDLTGDGLDDFVVNGVTGKYPSTIRKYTAISANGSILWQRTFSVFYLSIQYVVANVTGDSRNEVVVADDGNLTVFDSHGNTLWKKKLGKMWGSFMIRDVTGDSGEEIVYKVSDYEYEPTEIIVFDGKGAELWRTSGSGFTSGDLNIDGKEELIVSDSARVRAYNRNLKALWVHSMQNKTSQWSWGIFSFIDLTGDSVKDVVFGSGQTVLALDSNGTLLWNFTLGNGWLDICDMEAANTSDGVRIAVGSTFAGYDASRGSLSILSGNGSLVSSVEYDMYMGPVSIADLDGDGGKELVAHGHYRDWTKPSGGEIHILSLNGTDIFNETFAEDPHVLVADMENDRVAELLINRYGLWIYELADLMAGVG